ncbi:MAG: hypothetical protein OEW09_03340 [Anaerolineae bacterium]|nr:hypothetical protein [Anaerolineae bacterium]
MAQLAAEYESRPFDQAQDRPFDQAQDRPFDHAQDRPLALSLYYPENI